jgi:SAM-dependent methyltransferase
MIMFTSRDSDAHWERFGQLDPYFGVISSEEYQADKIDDEAKQRFLASGKDHIDYVFKKIRMHLSSEFAPQRVLDFGCGVGRLVLPLAALANEVVGVDVSPSMINEARKNCADQKIENVRFLTNIKESPQELKFDFIHSFIVFQHIPTRKGEAILKALIDRLREGGVGVLHFTYHAPLYARIVHWIMRNFPFACNAYNIAVGRKWSYPIMQSNFYNMNRLFFLLQSHQCSKVYTEFTLHQRNSGVLLFFQKDN